MHPRYLFAASRLVVQGALFSTIYFISRNSTQLDSKYWINVFFISSIISLVLSGERHLSINRSVTPNTLEDEAAAYLRWPLLLSLLIFLFSITVLPVSRHISTLLVMISVELLYGDYIRIALISNDIVKASKVNIVRAASHCLPLGVALWIENSNVYYFGLYGYIFFYLFLFSLLKPKYIGSIKTVLTRLKNEMQPKFISAALFSRLPYTLDKNIFSIYAISTLSADYALITAAASSFVSVIDNAFFQTKLADIISNSSRQRKLMSKLFFRSMVCLLLALVFALALHLASTYNFNLIYHGDKYKYIINFFGFCIMVNTYLNLNIYSYMCIMRRNSVAQHLSCILPIIGISVSTYAMGSLSIFSMIVFYALSIFLSLIFLNFAFRDIAKHD